MFCRQCEQTANGEGCDVHGVCGKSPSTADLQDGLIHVLKGISVYANHARENGLKDDEVDLFVIKGLFTTITNVNFDDQSLIKLIREGVSFRDTTRQLYEETGVEKELPELVKWNPSEDDTELVKQVGKLPPASGEAGDDRRSLREILLYGLKGMAAYADHAHVMGKTDEDVNAFFHKGLASLVDDGLSAEDYIKLIMDFGGVNLRCMEILDEGHNETFGHPTPTSVMLGVRKGPAIVVSGHDLPDLKMLLEQTIDKGVNIYTHGEMLPAHGYPELNRYEHLAGHFGSAWQNQVKEFNGQPAAFLFTTNCIQKPLDSYKDRVFTTGLVRFEGLEHIDGEGDKDFSPVIEKALELEGYEKDDIEKEITVGFGHHTVLGLADKIVKAVKDGDIKHFFLIGGCDGAKPGRNYYTKFAEKVPEDCIILTLACGKFRINRLELGTLGEFPRLLDCGQCNDAYSAIKIAQALAEEFDCGINELPLSLILSWYEQKAVCILLTLLSLGVKDIRLGPTLPAFMTPAILDILVEKFRIKPLTTPEQDLEEILGE